jgi:hypothetical protein
MERIRKLAAIFIDETTAEWFCDAGEFFVQHTPSQPDRILRITTRIYEYKAMKITSQNFPKWDHLSPNRLRNDFKYCEDNINIKR